MPLVRGFWVGLATGAAFAPRISSRPMRCMQSRTKTKATQPTQAVAASLTWVLASGLKSLALWLGKRLSGRCRVMQMLAS